MCDVKPLAKMLPCQLLFQLTKQGWLRTDILFIMSDGFLIFYIHPHPLTPQNWLFHWMRRRHLTGWSGPIFSISKCYGFGNTFYRHPHLLVCVQTLTILTTSPSNVAPGRAAHSLHYYSPLPLDYWLWPSGPVRPGRSQGVALNITCITLLKEFGQISGYKLKIITKVN